MISNDRADRRGHGKTHRRAKRKWGRLERLVPVGLVLVGLVTFVLGIIGLLYSAHAPNGTEATGIGQWRNDWLHALSVTVFTAAGLLILEPPPPGTAHWALSAARFGGVITAFLGVLYLVMGVYGGSVQQWRLWRFGRAAVRGRRPLVVICGLGRIGRQLVDDLTAADAPARISVVAIELDAGNPEIETAREMGAVVVLGDARDATLRRRARLDAAERVFVVCGDDSTNLDVAAEVVRDTEIGKARNDHLVHCYANVVSATLAKAAHDNPVFAAHGRTRFEIFNVIDNSARHLVKEELGARRAPHRDEVAHYILFGFGTIGQAVALHAGKLAHFENDRRLRMTIIDDWEEPAARKSRRRFLERHPAFCPEPDTFNLAEHVRATLPEKDAWSHRAGRPADPAWQVDAPLDPTGEPIAIEYVVNAEFLDLPTDVDAPRLIEQLTARLTPDQTPSVRPCVIVCFDEDRHNLEGALRIAAALRREGLDLPLYVYLPDERGLATFLRRGREDGALGDMWAFGACEVSAAYSRLVQPRVIELATRFREGFKAARRAAGDAAPADALDLAFWASDQEAAHHVDIKLAAVERMRAGGEGPEPAGPGTEAMITPAEREALARMEHNRYVAERLLAGWRYGPRDDVGKRRESLVSWQHLPREERVKDFQQIEALARWLEGNGT